jgi:hypothetical protein
MISIFGFELSVVGVKTTRVCLSTHGKPFNTTRPLSFPAYPGFLYEISPLLLGIYQPLRWFPGVLVLRTSFPFNKISQLFHALIPSPNLSCIRDYFTLNNSFNLPFQITFDVFWFPGGLVSVRSVGGSIRFQQRNVEDGVNFPPRRDIEFVCPVSFFSITLNGPYNFGLSFFEGRLVLIFFAFTITKSPI